MAKNARKTSKGTWRDLKDDSSKSRRGAPMSWKAKLRVAWIWTKRTFAVAMLFGICFCAYIAWEKISIEDFAADISRPISRIEFKTDGAISAEWLNKFLKIPRETKLSDVNIFAIKLSLEKIEQIKSAEIERDYPDVLRIKISEHKPIMKMRVKVDSQERIYAMSDEGVFFTPLCLPPEFIAKLMWLEGHSGGFDGSVPRRCMDVEKLGEFLGHVQERMPKELENWREVDISGLHSKVLPIFSVKTVLGTKIIFSDSDYKKQFDNLEYILRYASEKSLNSIEQIDLTPKGTANMKLSDGISK